MVIREPSSVTTATETPIDTKPFDLSQVQTPSSKIIRKASASCILIYVRCGEASLFIEENCIKLQRYDFVAIAPGTEFHIDPATTSDVLCILKMSQEYIENQLIIHLKQNKLLFGFFSNIIHAEECQNSYLLFRNQNDKALNSFNNLSFEYRREQTSSRILTFFLAIILEELCLQYEVVTCRTLYQKENIDLVGILKFIEANLNTVTLNKLADQFHYSPSYLSASFKKQMSMNYSEYVKKLKMEKAEDYLIHTDFTVAEIAGFLGYSDRSQFFQTFKSYYKTSPSEFKRSRKEARLLNGTENK